MTPFSFATAAQIVFGAGASAQAPGLARGFGARAFVVTGAAPARGVSRWNSTCPNGGSS